MEYFCFICENINDMNKVILFSLLLLPLLSCKYEPEVECKITDWTSGETKGKHVGIADNPNSSRVTITSQFGRLYYENENGECISPVGTFYIECDVK